MPWTINGVAFATARVLSASRDLQAGGGDSCRVEFATELDDDLPYEHGDSIEIHHPNGTLWFQGVAFRPGYGASSKSSRSTMEVKSKWHYLEMTSYTAQYSVIGSVTPSETEGEPSEIEILQKRKSRVCLNYSYDGTLLRTDDAFKSIIDYVNTMASAGIGVGSVLTGIYFPLTESLDQKCNEPILGNLVRWHPDSIIYFDYPNGGALCWQKRQDLPELTLTAGQSSRCKVVSSQALPDLIPAGVAIHYESTKDADGEEYVDIIDDIAGDGDQATTIHFTFDVDGGGFGTVKQAVKTQPLPQPPSGPTPASPDTAANKKWAKAKFPALRDLDNAHFKITKVTQTVNNPEEDEDLPDSFPREMLTGLSQDWMEATGVKSARVVVSIDVRFIGPLTGTEKQKAAIRAEFAPTGVRTYQVEVLGTQAVTKTYKKLESVEAGERIVSGLAAAYYASLTTLQSAGRITLKDVEVDPNIIPGRRLVLTGVPFEDAMIQSVSQDTRGGETTITFGPHAPGLSPGDMLEYMRAFTRTTKVSFAQPGEGTDAKAGAGKGIDGGKKASGSNQMHLAPESHEFFTVSIAGETKVRVEKGVVYQTVWNDSATDPKPTNSLKATEVSATEALTVGVGDKLYVKMTLTESNYEPEGGFSAFDHLGLSWSGSVTGSWSGALTGLAFEGSVTNPAISATFTGSQVNLPVGTDEGERTFELTWSGSVNCSGGAGSGSGSGSGTGSGCDCACTVEGAVSGLLLFTPEGTIAGSLVDPSVTGTVIGSVNGTLTDLAVTGKITPSSINIPSKVKLKIKHWDVNAATIEKHSTEPTSDHTKAFWLIAEIVEDSEDGGISIRQRHTGAINLGSMIAVQVSDGTGGGA